MIDPVEADHKALKNAHAVSHMANERTFLAWIRTSIGIMAFGFVVEKFALFIKQIDLILGRAHALTPLHVTHSMQSYSSLFGVLLVALGGLICLLAFIQYKKIERQIEEDDYQPAIFLNALLTLSVLVIGIFLVFYLRGSI